MSPASTSSSAQKLLGLGGRYSEIAVAATAGTSSTLLASRISGAVGPGYQVLTADQLENLAVSADFKAFSLLSSVLVVLGAIVLFVAAFLVVNTFSIVVAQRTRELGLLRCLGASRAQLMGSVLAEALVVGLIAAVAGVVLGIVGAVVLLAALPGAGLDLPSVSPSIASRRRIRSSSRSVRARLSLHACCRHSVRRRYRRSPRCATIRWARRAARTSRGRPSAP